jgi:hypothetical protein
MADYIYLNSEVELGQNQIEELILKAWNYANKE